MDVHVVGLELPSYRGLRDFHLDLNDAPDIGVLVGRNGRGKSRVLHALVEIFGSLRRKDPAGFGYSVKYVRSDLLVQVVQKTATSQPTMKVTVPGRSAARVQRADWHRYLPDHVFGYQATRGSAWDEEFERHSKADLDASRRQEPTRHENEFELGLRPLFQCDVRQLPLILLALLPDWSERFGRYAEDYAGIRGIASAELTVRKPSWFRTSPHAGQPYWGLKGYAPILFDRAASMGRFGAIPDKYTPSDYSDFRITLANPEDMASFLGLFDSAVTMFATLERLDSAEILTADIRLTAVGGDQIRPQDLSAGEQQLLTVLGMLRLQQGEESLFLLDEPASHFHPGWSQRWYASVKAMLEDGQKSQFIAATHDPALVSNIPREQLRILRCASDGTTTARIPAVDHRGRGIGGILTSELYELTSQLDTYTQQLIDEQYELSSSRSLTPEELDKLRDINNRLATLGFATSRRDEVVALFLAELDRRRKDLLALAAGEDPSCAEEIADLVSQLFDERLTRGL
ncbi:AAA family ATPase [Streptomyces sp. NPDC059278]|uniref:AAA family ATPase n=1 Tax=Streptomyces sp. NPDC059278 TaxID=3346801 RepID=UPI0036746627